MITAIEIRNSQFKKGMRGFREEEVKNFLHQVAQDYEKVYSENMTLKDQMQRMEFELSKYRQMEETMNNSLILAQQTAQEVKQNARKEAGIILEESRQKISELLMIYQDVIKRLNVFSADIKAQISGQMEMMERNQNKLDEMASFFYGKDLKELLEDLERIKTGEA